MQSGFPRLDGPIDLHPGRAEQPHELDTPVPTGRLQRCELVIL